MAQRRWVNQTQPQTLQIAVFLLYINAAFGFLGLLSAGVLAPVALALIGAGVAAGYGIANEQKWGYGLGLAMALLPFILRLLFVHNAFATDVVQLMFEIALVALLVHPQSRDYQRIWFR
jgi:hypothetical protein